MNLLKETVKILEENKKTLNDIVWFGNKSMSAVDIDLSKFLNVEYDAGYGGNEICSGLILVGKNFWLERGEYDGSEWWEFKKMPTKPRKKTRHYSVLK